MLYFPLTQKGTLYEKNEVNEVIMIFLNRIPFICYIVLLLIC